MKALLRLLPTWATTLAVNTVCIQILNFASQQASHHRQENGKFYGLEENQTNKTQKTQNSISNYHCCILQSQKPDQGLGFQGYQCYTSEPVSCGFPSSRLLVLQFENQLRFRVLGLTIFVTSSSSLPKQNKTKQPNYTQLPESFALIWKTDQGLRFQG